MFDERKNAPSTSDNRYYKDNPYYKKGFGLPNCTAYAYGRFWEVNKEKPTNKLWYGNAEDWFNETTYPKGQTPKLGAIMCFSKGKLYTSSDGAGHVCIVEKINEDGSVDTSNSGYKSTLFWRQKFTKPYSMNGYKFLGFIYPFNDVTYEYKYVISEIGLNIRDKKEGNIIGCLSYGTKVKVYKIQDKWAKIDENKWVYDEYLSYEIDDKTSKIDEIKENEKAEINVNIEKGVIMNKENFKLWCYFTVKRTVYTFAETCLAVIGTSAMINEVNWLTVLSTSSLASIICVLKCIIISPDEYQNIKGE